MNKAELITKIKADVDGATIKEVDAILTSAFENIKKAVAEGDYVRLIGFGSFECAERSARTGRNPKTNEQMVIPATKVCKFRPGSEFKDMVAK